METKIVTIGLDARSYDIYIGAGLLFRMNDFLPVDVAGRAVFIVTDENVEPYAQKVCDILSDIGAGQVHVQILPPGEQTKSFSQLEALCGWFLDNGVKRDSLILAVGGGVIGDLTGFAAATIMRGVPYVQIPTTLLAQVDSAVGGKTGINMKQGKNLVGNFYQPGAVVTDIDTLKTLPKRELLAGYAEIVKYGLIGDESFFSWLEKNGRAVCDLEPEALAHAIEVSVKAKAAIVEADEREAGKRALLNLGHTFGHALEAAAGYDGRLLHGEAVAIGMVMAYDLSVRMGLCDTADYERVEAHLADIGLPTRATYIQPSLNADVDRLLEIMGRDKKAEAGHLKFIVVDGIGHAFVSSDVPEDLLRAVLKDSLGDVESGAKGQWKSEFSSHS